MSKEITSITRVTNSPKETQKLGADLAKLIKPPCIIALSSDLGGGKTTFVQGIARGLGIKERVISPTFVLEKIYAVPKKKFLLYHYDVYRLKADPMLVGEILENAENNLVVIEWADKIKKYLPKTTLWVKISETKDNQRKFHISSYTSPCQGEESLKFPSLLRRG